MRKDSGPLACGHPKSTVGTLSRGGAAAVHAWCAGWLAGVAAELVFSSKKVIAT